MATAQTFLQDGGGFVHVFIQNHGENSRFFSRSAEPTNESYGTGSSLLTTCPKIRRVSSLTVGPGGGELHFELQLPAHVFGWQAPTQGEADRLNAEKRHGENTEMVAAA